MFTLTWTIANKSIEKQPSVFMFEPSDDRFTLGRSATCDRQIQADGISRIHCTLIKKEDNEWTVVDGDGTRRSSYGIFYPNGEKITSTDMIPGQAIVLLNSSDHQIVLKRDRRKTVEPSDRDLTVGYEMSTRVLTESLNDQTGQLEARFEWMMQQEREHHDSQLLKIREFLEVVYDETKRLRTDFSVSAVDDSDRDKKIREQRTLTKVLALVLGCAGLWLLVKDQQTASNIAGVVIMVGGAIGWGKSGKN
jgi:hypothetical protein